MSVPNESERRRWNDDYWSVVWPKRERLTDEVTADLLDAASLEPGERVLDVGCGGGRTALAAAQVVGDEGVVIGADISEPLSRLARRRAAEAGLENLSFEVADVQTDRVGGAPFDAAISQFGVMFFDEPETAFRNIGSHLRPGGRIAFACWASAEENPWYFAPAVAEFVPPPPAVEPGRSPTGPFSLADAGRTTSLLEAAGFVDVRRRVYESEVEVPQGSVVDEDHLAFIGIPEKSIQAAQNAVDARLARFRLASGLSRFPLAFQVFRAAHPGPQPASA
jgi:SAM-dependent methyltransferase